MRLTKLEVKGFKSFGDKVTIHFDEGITGIVGPNGCGKSNVVDAIRWVLGEQRARSLRSEKMDNIIFNGTKNRKPTQLAEVSLSFENTKNLLPTEYSHVTITRKYYRSGESEYQLNGVTCRLKDITGLFLDTGISSNSYAIIELAMVDHILNDRDHSRRGLFEEAAGISKFKKRKQETLRKLNDTDASLERAEDLMFEMEENLKSLEKQAKQTQKYYQLKADYKKYSLLWARTMVGWGQEELNRLKAERQAEEDKKTHRSQQLAEQEAALAKHKTEQVYKEKTLASRQKGLNDHVNHIREYESEKKVKNERLRLLNDKVDGLAASIEEDRKSSEAAENATHALEQERIHAQKILQDIAQQLEARRRDFETEKERSQVSKNREDAFHQKHTAQQEKVHQLIRQRDIKSAQIVTLKQALEKAATDASSRSESLQQFQERLTEVRHEKQQKEEALRQLAAKDQALKAKVSHLEEQMEGIKEELTQLNRKRDASLNEYQLTKSLVENLEGFPDAIRFLKQQPDWKDAPLLSEVLNCPEAYQVAIENYLEPYMNYYVVATDEEAFRAIRLLDEASKGRAHFFVLDRLQAFRPRSSAALPNTMEVTNLLTYDSKYQQLMAYLFDGVFVTFLEAYHQPKPNAVVLSKSGKVMDGAFSISGGSVGLFEGKKMGKAQNMEKLQATIQTLIDQSKAVTTSLNEKNHHLNRLKAESWNDSLKEAQADLNRINETLVSITTKQEQYYGLVDENKHRSDDLLEEINALQEEITQLDLRIKEEQNQLDELTLQSEIRKEDLATGSETLQEKSALFNEENLRYHQQQNEVRRIAQDISYKTNDLETTKRRLEKYQSERRQINEEIQQLVAKAGTNDDELIAMYEEKEAIESAMKEAEKDYYTAREDIGHAEENARELQKQCVAIDQSLMEVKEKLSQTIMDIKNIKERWAIEFDTDMDQLSLEQEEEPPKDVPEEELQARIESMKKRLKSMGGSINHQAVEAYNEAKERHDFFVTQKTDLLEARASLLTTVEEIDQVAKDNFLEAFKNIRENFIRVFRSLFAEGDECELSISDPDNPLESAIDIMAKPKGKRPLTINQLSGGEKTLTAISLLFAIYLLKPAPFCIFDEVDAPLDDSNIDKFNQIIKTFSNASQYIIVTHNKRTMSATDIIYGITMIEQGVSKVVPVKFKDL